MVPSTVIIVVFVSLGCVCFVGFCLFALWFLIRRRCKKMEKETDIIHADEHFRVKKDVMKGPHGSEAVVVSIEKDKRFDEEIIKNEGKVMQGKAGEITGSDLESGESSSNHYMS
ncbi:hypothetical protein CDL12_16527 [Handroanthus impetiginosus]|uniref:Uncharacterized protein n=1 Tax=Handroanthus impetiginosus TaxID=429701 RepID=A0A2G9H017_9LAMI|nr:hypothetical protein CDL12_16527 [Handroanthus impetiginosus]